MEPSDLTNHYHVMRHGQSLANTAGIIVSAPENGVDGYGLSPEGRKQAAASWQQCTELGNDTVIWSSDFLRTSQTATIVAEGLGIDEKIVYSTDLRERFFGEWELTSSRNYEIIWRQDLQPDISTDRNVEPVKSVLNRALRCLQSIEAHYSEKNILLVSHGDTLQILLTWFMQIPSSEHRSLPHLDVAQIRKASSP